MKTKSTLKEKNANDFLTHTKRNRGITIITLVITIIILLILAGISIASLIGNDGLINKAKKAAKDYENAQNDELEKLEAINNKIEVDKVSNGNDANDKEISNEAVLEEINKIKEEMEKLKSSTISLDTIYPVGSVYISTDLTTAEAVSQKFGGTWESYGQGRTLIGVGTGNDGSISRTFALNSIGGEYMHTLTVAEMPIHSHGQRQAFVYYSASR